MDNSANFSSSNLTIMKGIFDDVEDVDFKLYKTFQILDDGLIKVLLIGGYVILGATIFFSLTFMLGACGLMCYKYTCRNVVYCSCVLLWILAIIHFLFALFFSFTTPLAYYGCIYITDGFENPELYNENLDPIFKDSSFGDILAICTVPKNEDTLLKTFLDPEAYTSISSLKLISDGLSAFNATSYS